MIKQVSFLMPLFVGTTVFAQGLEKNNSSAPNNKYNYLVLLTDDQSFNTLQISGNRETSTPNMNRIINSGVYFNSTHVMGGLNGAISQPSRAMLMTGVGLMDVRDNGSVIPECQMTFPEYFRSKGYITFATGKWHSDSKSFNRSFCTGANIFFGGMHSPGKDGKFGHVRPFLHQYRQDGDYNKENGAYVDEGSHTFSSELYANAAISFLEQQKDSEQPFLMYVAFTSPHDPRNVLPDYGKKFSRDEVSLPANFLPEHPFDNGDLHERDEELLPFPRDPELVKQERAYYYSMINEVDVQIGRVLDALEKNGKLDSTIIIFASDNGLSVGEHGLLGKQNLYEASVKVPLAISGPGIPKGEERNAMAYLYDIYPTLCEMSGYDIPASVKGHSLLPVIDNEVETERDDIFLAYMNLQRAIKKGNYKLILYNVDGQRHPQLFDLKNDPKEKVNLYDNPDYSSIRQELTELLYQRMKESGDFCNPDLPDWGYPTKIKWQDIKAISKNRTEK